jgi:hypothetical protein
MAMKVPPRLFALAIGGAAVGALLIFIVVGAAKGCGGARMEALEMRVAKLEGKGAPTTTTSSDGGTIELPATSPPGDHAACAVAKVAAYDAWQEAAATAKKTAGTAEAQCADIWSEKKKQGCYYAASSSVRATQAARDAVMKGGTVARDAVKAVKDYPKNDAITKARAASEAAFAACQSEDPGNLR